MKRLLISAILLLPLSAIGEHMDVIEFELKEACSFSQYMDIVSDFNKWAANYGYHAEVAVPLHSDNMTSLFWLGTSANAATFGKTSDTWRDLRGDPDSEPAKLTARIAECSKNLSRRGYKTH